MLLAFAADVEAAGERPQDSPKAHRQQRFLHCGSGRHGRAGVAGSRQRGARSRRAAAVVRNGHADSADATLVKAFARRFSANLASVLTPRHRTRSASRTPRQPGHQSPRKTKQLSSRHDAAQYHEPRIGDSAHVQCRTSLCSLPASNACAPHTGHDERNARVHAADAASRFQPLRCRHLWCRSRVRAGAARARRAQHQRARWAHALGAAPVIVRFNQRARADFLLHEGGGN